MVVYRPSCVLSDGGNEVSIDEQRPRQNSDRCAHSGDRFAVNKGAQEVTFTKLNDTFWIRAPGKSRRFSVFTMGSLLISIQPV